MRSFPTLLERSKSPSNAALTARALHAPSADLLPLAVTRRIRPTLEHHAGRVTLRTMDCTVQILHAWCLMNGGTSESGENAARYLLADAHRAEEHAARAETRDRAETLREEAEACRIAATILGRFQYVPALLTLEEAGR